MQNMTYWLPNWCEAGIKLLIYQYKINLPKLDVSHKYTLMIMHKIQSSHSAKPKQIITYACYATLLARCMNSP